MIKIKQENWEWIDIDKLKTDNSNPNRMNESELKALKKNIVMYGWNMPIITDMDYLIADGEQKLKVAKELSMSKVPVLRKELTDTDRRVIRQSMNKLRGSHSEDLDLIEYKKILEKLNLEEFTSLTAINEQEVLNILNKEQIELKKINEVDKLGVLEVTCPKCGHIFQKKDK